MTQITSAAPETVDLESIRKAAERIQPSIYETPFVHSETLSSMSGNRIFLKLENLQMTGSFKERGALNRILTLGEEQKRRGVITASAGNHGQAVSWHATRRGIPAEVWMPVHTPLIKVSATRSHGAKVVLHGAGYDDAAEGARARCAETGGTFLHPFDDPAVIAGQGTIGLELLRQQPDLDAVYVPVGGGGLIGGLACAVKEQRRGVEVVGVQTSRLPSMKAALSNGAPVVVESGGTLADGIAVRRAGDFTLPLVTLYVDRMVTVEEEEIAAAILILLEREKTLAEGAGAVGLAAVLGAAERGRGRNIGIVISGGNLDVTMLSRIIERGLLRDGRRLRLRVTLQDYPGALQRLSAVIAGCGANIVETHHTRGHYGLALGETAIDVTMETRGREHVDEILQSLGETHSFSVVD